MCSITVLTRTVVLGEQRVVYFLIYLVTITVYSGLQKHLLDTHFYLITAVGAIILRFSQQPFMCNKITCKSAPFENRAYGIVVSYPLRHCRVWAIRPSYSVSHAANVSRRFGWRGVANLSMAAQSDGGEAAGSNKRGVRDKRVAHV